MTSTSKTKVFILVKTYPAISKKHVEVVCTAGIKENGEWIRMYPIPFQKFDEFERFKKYQWIEATLRRNSTDKRFESHKLESEIKLLDIVNTDDNWRERRKILDRVKIYTNLDEIISANKQKMLSLCAFKPSEIIDIIEEFDGYEWSDDKKDTLKKNEQQCTLFGDFIRSAKKLPYKFRYKFKDDKGKESMLMIEDWELGALYWNLSKKYPDEKDVVEKVKQKYREFIKNRDVLFFLGTTATWDGRAPNPFLIIGLFYPPKGGNMSLFD